MIVASDQCAFEQCSNTYSASMKYTSILNASPGAPVSGCTQGVSTSPEALGLCDMQVWSKWSTIKTHRPLSNLLPR